MKPAPAARELTQLASLRAQIRVNETWQGRSLEHAEARARSMFQCSIDELTTEQAYQILKAQAADDPPQIEPHNGFCISCGKRSSLRERVACHEGLTLGELEMRERKAALRG